MSRDESHEEKTRRVERWRAAIDFCDDSILTILDQRVEVAQLIGSRKRELGLPIRDAAREEAVLGRLVERSKGGALDERAVRAIFGTILEETRRLEEGRGRTVSGSGSGSGSVMRAGGETRS